MEEPSELGVWLGGCLQEVATQEGSTVFLKYLHTMENISIVWNWTKLWKLDFPTLFYDISKIFPYYGKGPIFPQ